jgi:methylglutamate dehydrogenase subunit D
VDDALTIECQTGFGLAAIMARTCGTDEELAALLGIALAAPGRCVSGGGMMLVSTGPRAWLAYAERGESAFAADLEDRLAGKASVSDQSSGYMMFTIGGKKARKLLQRGAPIDLHPDAFPPGSAATTVIAHIGALLWLSGADDRFHVAVFRSYAASFEHWLNTVAVRL